MRRMRISSYCKAAFVKGEAPTVCSIRKGIQAGTIPGERVGGTYFIYVNDDLSLAPEHTKEPEIKPVNNAAATILKAAGMIQ